MFDGVKSKIFPILDPHSTSRKILAAIEKKRLLEYHTMDNFTGRKKDAEHGKGNN